MKSQKLAYVFLAILISFFVFLSIAKADIGHVPKQKEPDKGAYCPVTTFTDQNKCYDCHEMRWVKDGWKWAIKLSRFHDLTDVYYHDDFVKIVDDKVEGYYRLAGSVSAGAFRTFSDYMYAIGVDRVTIDISSGGGSLIDGWEICSMIQQMINRGIHVTTQIRAYCASAAFMVFLAGEERLVEPTAYMMTHELWTLAFLKLETPSSKEDEAKTMRMFQDTINNWIAERSGVSKEKLDSMIRHKDWWMSGKDAVEEWKFATGYIK